MTLYSPRIYTYKITFEEVPYYYYGVHKEKRFDEEYWGSPYTHKWCWELYTPKKQILEIFEYSDKGWLESNLVEDRLIKPVFNTDKLCLNESYGGYVSIKIRKENGKKLGLEYGKTNGKKLGKINVETGHIQNLGVIYGNKHKENKTGVCGLSKEELIDIGRKSGYKTYELGVGVHGMTAEQRTEAGRNGGSIGGKISGRKSYELGIGIHGLTTKQRSETAKKVAAQRWKCTETGFITNAGNLTKYQRAKDIDTSKRIRIS